MPPLVEIEAIADIVWKWTTSVVLGILIIKSISHRRRLDKLEEQNERQD